MSARPRDMNIIVNTIKIKMLNKIKVPRQIQRNCFRNDKKYLKYLWDVMLMVQFVNMEFYFKPKEYFFNLLKFIFHVCRHIVLVICSTSQK